MSSFVGNLGTANHQRAGQEEERRKIPSVVSSFLPSFRAEPRIYHLQLGQTGKDRPGVAASSLPNLGGGSATAFLGTRDLLSSSPNNCEHAVGMAGHPRASEACRVLRFCCPVVMSNNSETFRNRPSTISIKHNKRTKDKWTKKIPPVQ